MKWKFCFNPIIAIIPILLYCLDFGYQGRDWYIGGNFTRVQNSGGEYVTTTNIGRYNGLDWQTYGGMNETDGQVRSVFVDTCLNVYIGGSFSKVSGKVTGPLAIKKYGENEFSAFKSTSFHSNPSPIINSISVDCKNIPTVLGKCNCDVYIGGKFSFSTIDEDDVNVTAVNVARYDSFTELNEGENKDNKPNYGWQALGGTSSHGMNVNDHEVYVVDKRNFGIQITANKLFLGGDFPGGFQSFSLDYDNIKEKKFEKPVSLMNGYVEDIYYDPWHFSISEVVIGGSMNFEVGANVNCTNLCIYDVFEKQWQVFDPEKVSRTIYRIDRNGNYLIIGGDRYLKKLLPNKGKFVEMIPLEKDYLNVTTQHVIKDFYVCKNVDLGCSSDSIAVVTSTGQAWFWNREKEDWYDFGLGIEGSAFCVDSKFDYYYNK